MLQADYLVVGAGLAGAVLAERLASAGSAVIVVEQRNHVGGNCFDSYDDAGILIHNYGPHIFHTNNQQVWDYLSRFTDWPPYEHRVRANFNGLDLTLPVNFSTFEELFGQEKAQLLEGKLLSEFGPDQSIPILKLRQDQDEEIRLAAEEIWRRVYLYYSQKQWGEVFAVLDPAVTGRVPVWTSRDDRYFKDKYQGLPKNGYAALINNILSHPEIKVLLGRDFREAIGEIEYSRMVYTGPLDYYFDYQFGPLPYRALDFQFQTLNQERYQDVAVVNYTGQETFTRITEFKHLTGQVCSKTTILTEYPYAYKAGENVPSYPILAEENLKLLSRYQELARRNKEVIFLGRLAEYKYYNMDEVVGRALTIAI